MINKILIFAIIIVAIYFYLKLARSPLFKKKRIVNGYEQYCDWWGRWKFTHIYVAQKKVGGKIWKSSRSGSAVSKANKKPDKRCLDSRFRGNDKPIL